MLSSFADSDDCLSGVLPDQVAEVLVPIGLYKDFDN